MGEIKKRRLGELLQEVGLVNGKEVERALKEGRKRGLRLGEALVELGMLTEPQIHWALAENLGLSYIHLTGEQIQTEVVKLLPQEMARRFNVLPLLKIGTELTLVVDDPLQEALFEDIARLSGCKVHLVLGRKQEIVGALDLVYGQGQAAVILSTEGFESERYSGPELIELSRDRSGAELLRRLLKDAVSDGASAIHIDRSGDRALVRFRVAGRLVNIIGMDAGWGQTLITRARIWAGSAETQEPGVTQIEHHKLIERRKRSKIVGPGIQYSVELDQTTLPVRLHTAAGHAGEAATIYILGKKLKEIGFDELGFGDSQKAKVEAMLGWPGLVIVTGPHGSGRAATVYSLLKKFDPLKNRIMTAENIIRQEHPEYTQIELGDDFSEKNLESLLGMDPDVLYAESMETVPELEAALRAGMSGAHVFALSTFHNPQSFLGRFMNPDLHLDRSLMAEGLNGIIAQRLFPRLCPACRKSYKLSREELESFRESLRERLEKNKVYVAKGCKQCQGRGFQGYTAVFEVMEFNDKAREAIISGLSYIEAADLTYDEGYKSINQMILEKALAGEIFWKELK